MDLGDGRGGHVKKTGKPSQPLIFTVPFSNEEILLASAPFEDGGLGVIYHPSKMGIPLPWKFNCPHCVRGLQPGLDITIKRAVKVLCSRRVVNDSEEYRIPTNGEPCSISWRCADSLQVKITQGDDPPVEALWSGDKIVVQKKSAAVRSKIINRTLKFLNSAKPYTRQQVEACLLPLLNKQRHDGIATHRRFPCLKIDWAHVLSSLE